MKSILRSVSFILLAAVMLGGCTAAKAPFEPQHKTETEVVNLSDGMIPLVIEKNVTYVQNERGGQWAEESSEITKWDIAPDFNISDSVWTIKIDDAKALGSFVDDSFKGRSATLYFHFGSESANIQKNVNGESSIDITLNMTGDVLFICNGVKQCFNDAAFKKASVKPDGKTSLSVDLGNGMAGDLEIPESVKKCEWKDFLIAQSTTYIPKVSFADLPAINVTSSCNVNGIWDAKIKNTGSGTNISPDLTWDAVDGATQYAVIMIDGTWLHMDVFTAKTSLVEGAVGRGTPGDEYVGPYPPKGNTHTYSVFVFALKNEAGKVPLSFDAGNNSIDKIYEGLNTDANGNKGNVLAYGRLDGNYTYK